MLNKYTLKVHSQMFLHEVLGNGDEPTDMSTFLLLKKENEGGWPVGVWDPSTPGTNIVSYKKLRYNI